MSQHISSFTDGRETLANKKLNGEDQFKAVVRRSQFSKILEKVVDESVNNEDWEALFNHGMCFCYGIDHVTNIL